ncbi:MAG: hypothetical protein CMF12_06040 [Idiomarina sp.]|uniref:Calx-beta domain-containing protein n=1 Tax=Idiomarina sp. TaxID=1874361 RepID=UPI000C44CC98|nr:Calx-beta domain-containing protein [Idiomarina sp.]MBT42067.1 hypothetical protein [Idiomarina sp.]
MRNNKITLAMLPLFALSACSPTDEESDESSVIVPEVSIQSSTVSEGDPSSNGKASIEVRLTRTLNEDLALNYTTVDGTAIVDKDYHDKSGVLLISKGSTTATLDIDVIGNRSYDPDRSFSIAFTASEGTDVSFKGDNEAVVTIENDDPIPEVGFTQQTMSVQETVGTTYIDIETSRPSSFTGEVGLEFSGVAQQPNRYVVDVDTITFEPGKTSYRLPITIIDDNIPRGGENITITLTAPQHIEISDNNLTNIIIQGDARLPDTGVTTFYNKNDETFSAATPSSEHLYQDASFGLDVDASDTQQSDGHASLSYTKLDIDGNRVPDNSTTFECVRDNNTGVVYEAKKTSNRERDPQSTYIWVNNDPTTNGGFTSIPNPEELSTNPEDPGWYQGATCSFRDYSQGGVGAERNLGCSTANYIKAMNAASYCGFSDWRIPSISELHNLTNFEPAMKRLDENYFPDINDVSSRYLSSTPVADNAQSAWCLDTSNGRRMLCLKNLRYSVRAVRSPVVNEGAE